MRKKRQASTRTSKKDWRYKGLTGAEAHLRTIKAWKTKKNRYHYGVIGQFAVDPHGADHFEDLVKRKQEADRHKRLLEKIEHEGMSPDEMEDILRAEGAAGEATGEGREQAQGAWRDYEARQADYYAQHDRFEDPLFRDWLRSVKDPAARDRFKALVEKSKTMRERERTLKVDPEETPNLDPTGRNETDIGYAGSDDKARRVASRLTRLVNQDPKITYRGRQEANIRIEIENTMRELGLREELKKTTPTVHDQQLQSEREHLLKRIHTSTADRDRQAAQRATLTAGTADEAEALDAEIKKRTAHEKNLHARLNVVNSELERSTHPNDDLYDRLRQTLISSHTSKTVEGRARAAEESRKLIRKASIISQDKWETKQQARHLAEDYPDLRCIIASSDYRKQRAIDPRLRDSIDSELGVDDAMRFARSKWEWERIKNRDEQDVPDAPKWFARQRRHKGAMIKGWEEGNASYGVDARGKIVPLVPRAEGRSGNLHKIAWGVAPNKEWEYTLKNPEINPDTGENELPFKQRIEFFDKTTDFGDQLMLDEHGRPMAKVVRKYDTPLAYDPGQRVLKNDEDQKNLNETARQTGIDEVVIVPVHGIKKQQVHTVSDQSRVKRHYFEKERDPSYRAISGWERGVPGTTGPGTFRLNEVDYDTWKDIPESERTIDEVPRQVQYVFVDPSKTKLAPNTSEQVSIQVPGATLPGLPRIAGPGVVQWGKHELGERRIITNLEPDSPRDKIIGNYVRTSHRMQFEDKAGRAQEVDRRLKMQQAIGGYRDEYMYEGPNSPAEDEAKSAGFSSYAEAKEFAAAATAAGIYGVKNKTLEGHIPTALNNAYTNARENHPKFDTFSEKHGLGDELLKVNDAWIRPSREAALNWKERFRHPLSDPSGSSFGVEVGRIRYRNKYWLNTEKRDTRRLERFDTGLSRIDKTLDYTKEHRQDTGALGAFRNWRTEPMMRHGDYKYFQDFEQSGKQTRIGNQVRLARQIMHSQDGERIHSFDPYAPEQNISITVTPKIREQAKKFHVDYQNIKHKHGHTPIPGRVNGGLHLPHIDPKNPLVIGTGVAATALATHYAYHKYTEHKKAEADRTSYYNKILPPPITVPFVNVRSTGWVRTPVNAFTNEFGIDNKKVPVRFGVSPSNKTLWKGRPVDRGYEANWGLGLNHIRSGKTKGGSLKQSAVFRQKPLRRNQKVGTHEVTYKGKRVPVDVTLGKLEKLKRTSSNPEKITNQDREDIVWAFKSTPWEQDVKNFYSYGNTDPVVEMFDDPAIMRRANKRKGTEGWKIAADTVTPHKSYVESASERGPGLTGQQGFSFTPNRYDDAFSSGVGRIITPEDIPAGDPRRRPRFED